MGSTKDISVVAVVGDLGHIRSSVAGPVHCTHLLVFVWSYSYSSSDSKSSLSLALRPQQAR